MDRRKPLFWGLLAGQMVLALLSWGLLFLLEVPVPVPLGTLPLLALAGAMSSEAGFWGCTAFAIVVYLLVALMLWRTKKGNRYGAVTLLVLYMLDLAVNVIFTATSWWYLLAVALDLAVLALVLAMALRRVQ